MYFWHWPAFFIGPIWMCYRKLYWQAIAYVIGVALLDYLFTSTFKIELPNVVFSLIGANLALPLALCQATSSIEKINAQNLPEDQRQEKIRLKGGTSKIAAGVATALSIAFIAIAIMASLYIVD